MSLFGELILVSVGRLKRLSVTPSAEEWNVLLAGAKKQSLVGVLMDAVSSLPDEQFPPTDIAREWMSLVVRIELKNKLNATRAAELSQLLLKDGFRSVVLKGLGVAAYYPRPDARQSGDIDIWVEGGHERLIEYLKPRYPLTNIQIHHVDASIFMDVETEVHYRPSWSYAPWVDRKYILWYGAQWEKQCANQTEYGYCVTTTSFNLVYLLMHIYRHIFIEGVGLRQLLDYYYVLISATDEERKNASEDIDNLSLKRFASSVMYVLEKVFNLDREKMLFAPDVKSGGLLLNEIEEGGNFGKYKNPNALTSDDNRMIRGAGRLFHNFRLLLYYPEEVLCYPVWMVWHWCWKMKNHYLK